MPTVLVMRHHVSQVSIDIGRPARNPPINAAGVRDGRGKGNAEAEDKIIGHVVHYYPGSGQCCPECRLH